MHAVSFLRSALLRASEQTMKRTACEMRGYGHVCWNRCTVFSVLGSVLSIALHGNEEFGYGRRYGFVWIR